MQRQNRIGLRPGTVDRWIGSLWRLQPVRRDFGWQHGQSIDRYYIEAFLAGYAADIRGHVLEIETNGYTHRFGAERVSRSEVLHIQPGNLDATVIADLTCANGIRSDSFDCIILTQTLQFIYDLRSAIRTISRILKPGGVLLATFPGISQISRHDMNNWGEFWRFTTLSTHLLFKEAFLEDCITIQAHGNVLTAMAFLHGLVANELREEELNYHDPDYELLITLRGVKSRRDLSGNQV